MAVSYPDPSPDPYALPEGARGGGPGAAGEGDSRKPHERILKSKGFIPTVVVVGLVLFVLLSSRLVGRPPQIDSITPASGKPGDVMIITGRYFGSTRATSEVRISGVSPTSSDYVEWTDGRISVTIPDEATSGIVYVITRNGRSGGLLFINRDQIPVLASGPAKPGEPYVSSIQPSAAEVGDKITISGMNFGLEKGGSQVYFTWAAGSAASANAGIDLAGLLPAREDNVDYVSWSDREIVLRVPDGAASGNVLVTSDKGQSNSVYFEVLSGAGTKFYASPRKYSVRYGMSVSVNAASGDSTLYLWLPHVIQTPEQRKVQLVSQDPEPMLSTSGPALYSFSNLPKGGRSHIDLSWMFDRYAVETQVNPSKVAAPDTTTELYRRFTAPDVLVPSASADVVKASAAAAAGEKNPYLKARRLYQWMLSTLTYADTAQEGDPQLLLRLKKGDDYSWAALYCALLRAGGIPSRMVAGYIAGDTGQPTRRHFWDEFYIDSLGWIPADPLLGSDKPAPGAQGPLSDPRTYYFGNLDNRHVTFTKGLEDVNQMSPDGKTVLRKELPYLFTIHEEAVGGITSYTTSFEDLTVSGTY
ncbi:MAG TPA: transglutaminase domain-containing protein [Spirochaetia bacterium]|nr:transglutaminase domain-containing protein [Spirochaetia bacterium]